MSSSGTPVFESNYEFNPGVVKAWISSYPNNPGVITVWTSNYENNPGVMKIFMTTYEHNPGVQKIYMSGCFPEFEFVNTNSDEYAPIGSLNIGDKICSWDTEKKKKQYTSVTKIHKYTVNDIFSINNSMQVSSTHPLMIIEKDKNDMLIPVWKVAYDVKFGDLMVGSDGKLITVKTKSRHCNNEGIEVINLSTENGDPFSVGNSIVRAENAHDHMEWSNTPLTQKLFANYENTEFFKAA